MLAPSFAKGGTAGYLNSRYFTIYGGASEVQKDIVAKKVLGLTTGEIKMNFELSEEQKMIQQSVERFVQENYDLTNRVKISSEDPGYSQEYWTAMAELGWLGLAFSEEEGGFGGNQIDTLVLMEQFGKGLVLEPFLANIVLGGGAIKEEEVLQLKNPSYQI